MYLNPHNTISPRQARHQRLVSGDKLRQTGTVRTCTAADCETRLSRYNPSDTCRLHEGWRDQRMRRYD